MGSKRLGFSRNNRGREKKHWQLAKGEGSGSYQSLFVDAYNMRNGTGGNNADSAPLSFVRGGDYEPGYSIDYLIGRYGLYWESKVESATVAWNLYFHSTALLPQDYENKGRGFAIRCVVR